MTFKELCEHYSKFNIEELKKMLFEVEDELEKNAKDRDEYEKRLKNEGVPEYFIYTNGAIGTSLYLETALERRRDAIMKVIKQKQ